MTDRPPPSLAAGKQITKGVSLLKPLTAGGMGAVWLADHLGLKTQVVVKFMLGSLDKSDSARTRFSREAAAAAQVKSPHVVQMLDHGVSEDGIPFIVMEHLEGHDLGDDIDKHGAREPAMVVAVITQVAKALSKVHAAGFLHRDIKPANIFLVDGEEDVFVKLLDFGIAKSNAADQGDGSLDGETKTGQVVGTPFYMSPEQVTAQKTIDHRSDLWALGVVAYEALTGKRPYDGPSFGALAVKIATEGAPRPTEVNPALPPALDAWFAKACARDPNDRFATAKEMSDAFRAAFEGVVSFPTGALSGDSGQRSVPGMQGAPAARAGSGSNEANTPEPHTPSMIGLAATALDDSDVKARVALGRSEAGVSEDVRPSQRSSRLVYVGAAMVLSVGVVFALITTFGASPPAGGAISATVSSVPAPSSAKPERVAVVPKHSTSITAPSSSTSVSDSSTSAEAPDAGAPIAPAPAPTRTTTVTTRPPTGHTPPTTTPTKPSAEPSAKPPTTKPSDGPADLF